MKSIQTITITIISLLVVFTANVYAQDTTTKLTELEQRTVIDSVGNKLMENYIFPEVANEMAKNIKSKFKKGDRNG